MDKFKYDENLKLRDKYNNLVNKIAFFRMVIFFVIIICFILGNKSNIFYFMGCFCLFIFITLIFIHDKYYKLLDYYNKYIIILDEYRSRMDGSWRNFKDKGEEFVTELLSDLDVVGDNSLFQYLNVSNTNGGRKNLIKKLSNNKISEKKLIREQEAIKELVFNIDFDINFLVSMFKFRNKKIDLENDFKYLDDYVGSKFFDLLVAIIFSCLCLLSLILGYFNIFSYNYFFGLFLFNFISNYMYSYIYRIEFEGINKLSSDYSRLNDVYKLVLSNKFESIKLKGISVDIDSSKSSIDRLVFINDLNNLKNNILSSFIFNGLFSVNIIVMYLFSKFQKNNISALKVGVCGVEELEALISLAGIGIVNNKVFLPIFDEDISLKFNNLRHPLIDANKVVGNDFDGKYGVNIITGSNMGGKTSFLRTIGINILLMNAGTYVCADYFKSSYFKIFTSISVLDDIDKGISTFYGELLRMKQAIDYKGGNRIVLVDEIFKGTNYNDRIYGATNVIKKVNDKKTILFITTHDFELCDCKISNLKNYHVKEYYEGDNIKFDYKIRNGKCNSTNAKYLMKKLDIID